MTITVSDFTTRFPEFVSEDSARIELFIADAELVVNETLWDVKYNLGLAYLTAHYLSLANFTEGGGGGVGSGTGTIASKSVDGVSVSYAVPTISNTSGNDDFYTQTSYGQRYLALRKTLSRAAFTV